MSRGDPVPWGLAQALDAAASFAPRRSELGALGSADSVQRVAEVQAAARARAPPRARVQLSPARSVAPPRRSRRLTRPTRARSGKRLHCVAVSAHLAALGVPACRADHREFVSGSGTAASSSRRSRSTRDRRPIRRGLVASPRGAFSTRSAGHARRGRLEDLLRAAKAVDLARRAAADHAARARLGRFREPRPGRTVAQSPRGSARW